MVADGVEMSELMLCRASWMSILLGWAIDGQLVDLWWPAMFGMKICAVFRCWDGRWDRQREQRMNWLLCRQSQPPTYNQEVEKMVWVQWKDSRNLHDHHPTAPDCRSQTSRCPSPVVYLTTYRWLTWLGCHVGCIASRVQCTLEGLMCCLGSEYGLESERNRNRRGSWKVHQCWEACLGNPKQDPPFVLIW